jgi:DNA-binding NtrC family response regulator
VLTDNKLPGPSGLDLISQVHATHPRLPMILMTGLHDTDTVIKSARLGALDYFSKPEEGEYGLDPATGRWSWLTRLAVLVEKAANCKRLMQEVSLPGETTFFSSKTDRLIGRSEAMQDVYKEIGRVAASSVTVLIRGETGTGKELVARAIFSHSNRPTPTSFIVVNCAAIPENLLESELFGHEAGSFTGAIGRRIGRFEQADGGTIFLDEIGDMNSSLQRKLLRVLQERTIERVGGNVTIPIDVRVIAATHRDLEAAIQANEFREDLYYRLNVATIQLPALRDRTEDIPDLVDYFIQRYGSELGSDQSTIPDAERTAIMDYLRQQHWPGNIRELRSAIRKALLLSHGYPLTLATVRAAIEQMTPPAISEGQTFAARMAQVLASARNGECENAEAIITEEVDRELYGQAYRRAMNDQTKAAQWLGVARTTMRGKLTRLGLLPSRSAP